MKLSGWTQYFESVVEPEPINNVSFSQPKQVIAMKQSTTLQLNPTISPSTVSKDKLNWSSSNSNIATVSYSGLVTGMKDGTVTITCEGVNSNGEKVSASCTVSVYNAALVSSLSFSQPKQVIAMKQSTTLQLNPTISPSTVSNDKLIWSSSNSNIATVSDSGLVTGKQEGTVTITCEGVNSNGEKVSASCTVSVANAALVSSLSFSQPKQVIAMKQSTTLQLNPTISPSTVSKDKLIWASSNSNIATVSNSGLVTGKKEGTVTITCEGVDANGEKMSASCEVFVFNGSQLNINSISFVSPTEVLEYSASKKTLQLNPTISPSTISKESLAWSSSDEDIATVSGSGLVTGKEYGTTTITCSAVNMQGEMVTASCRVIVYKAGLIYVGNIFYGLDPSGYAFVTNCAGGIPSNVNKERHEYSGTVNVSSSVTYAGVNYPVKAIGTYAFYNQPALQAVQIPTSVLTFEPSAFEKSKNLARVLFANREQGLISVGERAFYECSKLNSVVLPNSTQRIDKEAFRHCSSLSNITLSNSLNYINEYAFADCPVLNNVVLPESLKSIQNAAFNNDAALSSIIFPAALEGIGASAFANCVSLQEVIFNTTNYTMTIGADAFKGSNAINKVKVAHLDSWVSINFSNPEANPASISHRLYSTGGSEIIDADVPEGPSYVNNNVFYNCQNLKSVTLPSSIQIINDNIFYGCSSLTKVMSKATTPPYFAGVDDPTKMNNVFNAADLYVPDASVSSYSSDDWWKRFKNIKKQSEWATPTTRTPFNGAINLPGTLEAENFDKGGEGITYHDSDAEDHGGTNYRSGADLGMDIVTGNGGYVIGWTEGGEWAEYTVNVLQAGQYTFDATISNGPYNASSFNISLVGNDGNLTKLAEVNIPTKDSWDNYLIATGDLLQSLEAGTQILRITITTRGCNIDKIKFELKEDEPAYQVGDDITSLATAEWEGKTNTYGGLANPAVERYTNGAPNDVGDILTQTVTDLRNGTYKVQLDVAASFTPDRGFTCPTGDGLSVAFANQTQGNLTVVERGWVNEGEQTTVTLYAVVTDGTLKYGIKNLAPSGNWFVAGLRSIIYVSEDIVAINDIKAATDDASTIYDLQGRRVKGAPQKGIYIKNGQKVWMK